MWCWQYLYQVHAHTQQLLEEQYDQQCDDLQRQLEARVDSDGTDRYLGNEFAGIASGEQ